MKGFVIYDLNSDFLVNIFENDNNREALAGALDETIIAYNATEKVIFLIRIAKDKNLSREIKLPTNGIIKFLLLYNDVLNKSGVTVINLLVTDEEVDECQGICESCKHYTISIKSLSAPDLFKKWLKEKSENFKAPLFC